MKPTIFALLFTGLVVAQAQNSSARKPMKVRVSGAVLDGVAIRKVLPTLPCSNDGAHDKGSVKIAVLTDYDGTVKTATAVSGDPQLANCAIAAIKQWQFKPYIIEGTPVQVDSWIVMKFSKKRVQVVVGER